MANSDFVVGKREGRFRGEVFIFGGDFSLRGFSFEILLLLLFRKLAGKVPTHIWALRCRVGVFQWAGGRRCVRGGSRVAFKPLNYDKTVLVIYADGIKVVMVYNLIYGSIFLNP
jgi:hypothetical protein